MGGLFFLEYPFTDSRLDPVEPTPQELDKLKAEIRRLVVAALQRLQSGPALLAPVASDGKPLLVLITGHETPGADFMAQVKSLSGQGFRPVFAVSRTASENAVSFEGASILSHEENEAKVRDTARQAVALVAPHLSANTAAKAALGIRDSLPSQLLGYMLEQGKPVCIGAAPQAMQAASPGYQRLQNGHLSTLQQMGVRFVEKGIAECVSELFRPVMNETPERLAKQKPALKREFVTAEDVWAAQSRGAKELVHGANAVVTDQAREYAASRGITLRTGVTS